MKAATQAPPYASTDRTIFQSTPPVKAATRRAIPCTRGQRFQSTPPVKAATKQRDARLYQLRFQSTPPVKAATLSNISIVIGFGFQSTPPVKAATEALQTALSDLAISIHAAREGGDDVAPHSLSRLSIFQSTPPVKAATKRKRKIPNTKEFQSTPPVKAATCRISNFSLCRYISIHAAREGGDTANLRHRRLPRYFNPRRP